MCCAGFTTVHQSGLENGVLWSEWVLGFEEPHIRSIPKRKSPLPLGQSKTR